MKNTILTIFICIAMAIGLACKDRSVSYRDELRKLSKYTGNEQKALELHNKAMEHHKKKEYKEAEKLWYEAAKANPGWVKPYFNLCCVNALQGKKEIALDFLEIAIGVNQDLAIRWALGDPDLASLRSTDRYKKMVGDFTNFNIVAGKLIEALIRRDTAALKSLISQDDGLTLMKFSGGKNYEKKFKKNEIDENVMNILHDDFNARTFRGNDINSYEEGEKNLCDVLNYYIDPPPPQGGPRAESWTDLCYNLKKIGTVWYLVSVRSEDNGGI